MTLTRKDLSVISCHQISRSYRGREVVHEVTFDVPAGQVTGLLGPNGAGKTTVLKGLLGLTTMSAGTIAQAEAPDRGFDRLVGSALDIAGFRAESRIRDVAQSYLTRLGADDDPVELLERVGLTDVRQRVGTLSQGMRQRLRVAMAVAGRPQVLVLDEPLNGLDPGGILWLRHLLRDHVDAGGAVLFSTHLLNEAERIVDRIVVLDHGRVLASGPVSTVVPAGTGLEECFFALTTTGVNHD